MKQTKTQLELLWDSVDNNTMEQNRNRQIENATCRRVGVNSRRASNGHRCI